MKLKPVVAGSFYPGKVSTLQKMLEDFRLGDLDPLPGEPLGLLLPHAGYLYSGSVAAKGYRALAPFQPSLVVVAGPSHTMAFKGCALFSGEAVLTPGGEVLVDTEACRILKETDKNLADFPPAYAQEHSVEVHFPLIEEFLPGVKVVPVIMGQGKNESVEPLLRGLGRLAKEKPFVLIASSDMSHYPDYETARKADHQFLEALLSGDGKKIDQTDREIMGQGYTEYHCTHCGKEPVQTLVAWAQEQGAKKRVLLEYRNSGDVTGDRKRVVGYGAAAFCR
jgi:AmmeMemoRadiSam system protein B